jgi:low affinity Fe/Cu permease
MAKQRNPVSRAMEHFSGAVTRWTGSSSAFVLAVLVIAVWAVTGPAFGFSDTWQLVINTGTTIVTFLMVFLIQRSQNKDSKAIQLKLNELVAAMEGASNRLIDVEDLDEAELDALHRYYATLVEHARRDARLTTSHSVEEARSDAEEKIVEKHGKSKRQKAQT